MFKVKLVVEFECQGVLLSEITQMTVSRIVFLWRCGGGALGEHRVEGGLHPARVDRGGVGAEHLCDLGVVRGECVVGCLDARHGSACARKDRR